MVDCPDYRYPDQAHQAREQLSLLPQLVLQESISNGEDASAETVLGIAGTRTSSLEELDPYDRLSAWVERLEDMDVDELSHTIGTWARQSGPGMDRRALLFKFSAALSLAAADPALIAALPRTVPARDGNSLSSGLAGIWHSRYRYSSSGRAKRFIGEHYVVLRQDGNQLVGQSIPAVNGSELRLELALDGTVVTGRWAERTSPEGYYRGAVYHGAIQLVLDPLGKSMTGRWIGFDREFNIDSDTWDLKWVADASTKRAQRAYHMKAQEVEADKETNI